MTRTLRLSLIAIGAFSGAAIALALPVPTLSAEATQHAGHSACVCPSGSPRSSEAISRLLVQT